ncbi:hypothetical protein Fcan01_22390 [Folsomia candida]|uniref:Uncharacterized protein n=1 Tax=Folsomia candida TaxID=158441 RepID=A0A226DBE0_FOLCA|nr:hypothetical protein Fcan01_22390 [Folsomia candida]
MGVKLSSFIFVTLSAISAGQILLGMGYIFVLTTWIILHNICQIDLDYKQRGVLIVARKERRATVVLYNRIVLLLLNVAPPLYSVALFMLVGCAGVIVVLNLMSIKMHGILPLNIYILGPFFSLGLIIVLNTVLKCASSYEVRTKDMLHRWKNDTQLVASGAQKEHSRRVAAMRPILLFMAVWRTNILPVDIKFMCDYNAFLVDGTIAVLLTDE